MLVLGGSFAFTFLGPIPEASGEDGGSSSDGFGPSAFSYKRDVTVSNPGNATDWIPVEVTLDTASMMDQGHLQSDCSDLRFTNDFRTDVLDYWIESGCGTNSTVTWVEIPHLPNGESTIHLYHGSSTSHQAENGLETVNHLGILNATVDSSGEDWSITPQAGFQKPVLTGYVQTRNGGQVTDVHFEQPGFRTGRPHINEAQIELRDPLRNGHTDETVAVLHGAAGEYRTAGADVKVEIGTVTDVEAHQNFEEHEGRTVSFDHEFSQPPATVATLNSDYRNGQDDGGEERFLSTHVRDVTTSSFKIEGEESYAWYMQDLIDAQDEVYGWMAFQQGSGTETTFFGQTVEYRYGAQAADSDGDGDHSSDNPEDLAWEEVENPVGLVQGITGHDSDGFWARGSDENGADSNPGIRQDSAFVLALEPRNTEDFQDEDKDDDGDHGSEGFNYVVLEDGNVPLIPERAAEITTEVGSAQPLTATQDEDDDGLPDDLEETLCGRQIARDLIDNATRQETGECSNATDYEPFGEATKLSIPSLVRTGADADNDFVPDNAEIEYTNVTINTSDTPAYDVEHGHLSVDPVDGRDRNASYPAPSVVCTPLDVPANSSAVSIGRDSDGDGFPSYVHVARPEVCYDESDPHDPDIQPGPVEKNWTVDPDDDSATDPVEDTIQVNEIPVSAEFSNDFDLDHIPCTGNVTYLNLTFESDDPGLPTQETWTEETEFDTDCNNQDDPVLFSTLDEDGDLVPDDAESHVCGVETSATSLDGFCTDLGTNYHPPSWYQTELDPLS